MENTEKKFKVLDYMYNENIIHFLVSGEDIMINATEMVKQYPGKLINHFINLKETQEYIKIILEDFNFNDKISYHYIEKIENYEALKKDIDKESYHYIEKSKQENRVYTIDDVYYTNKKGGTFMCRDLALSLATWLDLRFKLWLNRTIDRILCIEYSLKFNKIIEEIENTKKQLSNLKLKIRGKTATIEDANKHLDALEKLEKLKSLKRNLSAQHTKEIQYKLNLNED
jgi:hypothetical protein